LKICLKIPYSFLFFTFVKTEKSKITRVKCYLFKNKFNFDFSDLNEIVVVISLFPVVYKKKFKLNSNMLQLQNSTTTIHSLDLNTLSSIKLNTPNCNLDLPVTIEINSPIFKLLSNKIKLIKHES
jgi:hypothetical protein